MCGYYLKPYNFSVRLYQGNWCLFSRQSDDVEATTEDQKNAVIFWALSNKQKYESLLKEK